MAKTTTAPLTQTVKNSGAVFINGGGVTAFTTGTSPANTQVLVTAGTEGCVVKSVRIASSNSAAALYLTFWLSYSGAPSVYYLLGTIPVPALSGASPTGSTVNVDVLGNSMLTGLALDQMSKPVLAMAASTVLSVGIIAAPAATQFVWVTAESEDF